MLKPKPKQLNLPMFGVLAVVVFTLLSSIFVALKQNQETAYAATNGTVNFQARLMTNAGGIVADGDYNVEFKLFNASAIDGGETPIQGSCTTNPGAAADEDCLWTETRTSGNKVTVRNGYLTVNLGSVTSFPTTINWDQDLWMTMRVGSTGSPSWDAEMSPRLKMTAVPYAFRAGALSYLSGANTAVLQFAATIGQGTVVTLPDPGAGTATVCYQNASACGFASASGSSSYIQLQGSTPGTPQTGNFNISGTGIAGILQAATIDTPSGTTTLDIGTTNATLINLKQNTALAAGKNLTFTAGAGNFDQSLSTGTFSTGTGTVTLAGNTSVASNKSFTANGDALFKDATNSTTAFQIQDASGISVLTVDTTANASNLVTNPSLEVDVSGWNARTGCTRTRVTTQALFGAASLSCVNTATGAGVNYPLTLTASTPYTVSFYVKSSASFSTLDVGYAFDGSNETTLLSSGISSSSGSWTRVTYSFNSGAVSGSPYFFIKQSDATSRTFYIDGMQVEAGVIASAFRDHRFSFNGAISTPLLLQNAVDSNTAFAVSAANGSQIFNVNTNTSRVGIGSMNPGARFQVQGGLSSIPVMIVRAVSGQASNILEIQDSSSNVNAAFSATGNQLTLGQIAGSGTVTAGLLVLGDGTTDNFGSTLRTNTLTSNQTIYLPDAGGTLCIQGASACGFAPGTAASYIQNGTGQQTSANFNIASAAAGSITALMQGAASGTVPVTVIRNGATPGAGADLLSLQNSNGSVVYAKFDKDGLAILKGVTINDTTNANAFNIQDANGTFVLADPVNQKFWVGSQALCGGRFCVGNTISAAGGATYTNALNSTDATISTTASTFIGQEIDIVDHSTVVNTLKGLIIDASSSTATSVFQGIQVKAASGTTVGNSVILQNGATTIFKVTNTGNLTLQATNSVAAAFEVNNSSSRNIFRVATNGSYVAVGNITSTGGAGVAGDIRIADGSASNRYFSIVTAGSIAQTTVITLPDPGAGTATFCYQSATACGFAPGTNASYIQNGTGQQTSASFNILSGAAGSTTGLMQGAASGTVPVTIIRGGATPGAGADLLSLQDSGSVMLAKFDNAGNLTFGNTADKTISIIAAASGNNGNALTIQGGAGTGTNKNGGSLTMQGGAGTGTGTSGAVTIQSANAAAGIAGNVTIDTGTTLNGTPTVSIGTANATIVNIANSGTNAATVSIANNNTAHTINIGNGTANNTIVIGSANGGSSKIQAGVASVTVTAGITTVAGEISVNGIQPASVAGNGTNGVYSNINAGAGGNTSGTTGQTAGNGAAIYLAAGAGGTAPGGSTNGSGGSIFLDGGAPGAGAGGGAFRGNVILQQSAGLVGIGTISPSSSYKVDIAGGGVNIASGMAYYIGGASLNTAGTLTNVAYLNQSQTFTGTNTFQPTTNITSLIARQTSVVSPTADIFAVKTANATNVIQVTGPSANNAAVSITAVGANAVTLTAGAASTWSTTAGLLTIQGGGGVTMNTPDSTSAATQAVTIQSGSASVGSNLNAGAVTIDTGTRTGSGTAILNIGATNAVTLNIANSGSNAATLNIANNNTAHTINIGNGAASNTIVIGSTTGGTTKLQGGSGTLTVSASTTTILGELVSTGIQPASSSGNGTSIAAVVSITAAKGGNTTGTTGQSAGNGGNTYLSGGDGGDAAAGSNNGWGGGVFISGGAIGAGGAGGFRGNVILQPNGGGIGIGTLSPSSTYKLDVNGDVNLFTGSAYRINGTSICTSSGCTASSASAILNQSGSAQSSSTFWISGVGRSDTGFQSLSFDAPATNGTVLVGTSNASALTLGKAANITTIQGTVKISTLGAVTANSAAFCRDTSTTNITACDSTNTTGRPFMQGGNNFGATGQLGTQDGNSMQIITNNVVRATFDTSNGLYLGLGTTHASPTAFTINGTGSLTAGTAGALLTIKGGAGASTTTGSAGGGVTIQGGNAGGSGVNVGGTITLQAGTATGGGAAGVVMVKGGADSTTGFLVQKAASGTAVFTVDSVNIKVLVGDLTNGFNFDVSSNPNTTPVYNGTARPTVRATLIPEYAGATLTADGNNNSGTMTSDFCSGSGRLTIPATGNLCGTNEEHNFYKWASAAAATNDYDIWIRYQMPSDFSAFTSDNSINMYGYRKTSSDSVQLTMYLADGVTPCGTASTTITGTDNAWTENPLGGAETGCTLSAGQMVIFRVHLTSTSTINYALAGAIRFDYYAKF